MNTNTICGSPNLPRFDSEQSAECFASRYLEPGDPITAARLERAVKTVLFGPAWTQP